MQLGKLMRALVALAFLNAVGCGSVGTGGSGGSGADLVPPSVPAGVTATQTGPQAITVNWQAATDAGTGVTGYHIFRNGGATAIASVAAGQQSYADSSLLPDTDYYYTVSAYDGASPPNESAVSAASPTVRTSPASSDTIAPSIPPSLAAVAQSSSSIQLTWLASTDNVGGTGLAGYRVFRNGVQVQQLAAGTLTFTDNGLSASTSYTYTVRAFDVAGNVSTDSNTATATTPALPDTTAPSIPQNLVAAAQSGSSIKLTWMTATDNAGGSGLAGYRVFRGGTQIQQLAAGTLTYTDNSLNASTQYSYTVRAYDNAGNESADSNTATATTQAPAVGMSARPLNSTCIAPARPGTSGGTFSLALQRVFPNLNFGNGNGISGAFQAPNDSTRWFVTELDGHIRTFTNNNAATSSSMFLDISSEVSFGGELGLFGIAFQPNFPTDPRAFVSYTTNIGGQTWSHISQFRTTDNGATLDPATETVLVAVHQPAANHNGGFIAFGPDGMLYFGLGDGGMEGDPWGTIGNGQNTKTLLGKILRIDVGASGSTGYTIPAGNPFAGNATCSADGSTSPTDCPEIYAWGIRNPWKASFDRQTGKLWLGDVGQDLWEEVDTVVAGGNYGWRCYEAAFPYLPNSCGTAPPASLLPPIAQFAHTGNYNSITGGYVYRGSVIRTLFGQYVFADFLNGMYTVNSAATPTVTVPSSSLIAIGGVWVSAFAEDLSGELYVVEYGGHLYKLTGTGSGGSNTIPNLLSATGCVSAGNATQPAAGLIPYAPSAPFWSDGAVKRRWIALPDGTQIDTTAASGDWSFPSGTVLVKDFSIGNQLIETRLFMRHPDGVWAGYTYEWNAAQTDATRVTGGKDVAVAGLATPWHFPSEAECMRCHTQAAGYSLGPETGQLNGNYAYPSAPSPPFTGLTANQLFTLNSITLFSPAISAPSASLPSYPDPQGSAGTLAERARAYLHTNCSQCHRPSGGTTVNLDLRYQTAIGATNTCGVTATKNLGIAGAKVIDPGNPANSMVYLRMHQRGVNQMPPIASNAIDEAGATLLFNWISGMTPPSCQ